MEESSSKTQLPSSFVNEYELEKIEAGKGKNGPEILTDEKMRICFDTLDGLLPKLGIFQKVMKALRDDLYDGVYSYCFTSNVQSAEAVERVPFFQLVNRTNQQRDEKAEKLLSKIRDLEEKNVEAFKVIDQKDVEIDKLMRANDELKDQLKSLQSTLKAAEETTSRLHSTIKKGEREKAELEYSHNVEVKNLKIELHVSEEESKALSIFKNSYDELKDAFENPHLSYGTTVNSSIDQGMETIEFENTRIGQIRKDLMVMDALEDQLHFVRNCSIQEYDAFLESNKKQYDSSHISPVLMKESFADDNQLERESKELAKAQSTFSNAILDINEELKLLLQHRNMLQAELARLEKDESNKKEARKTEIDTSEGAVNEAPSLEELDLVEIMVGNTEDPFVPHENILNKYSSMIYTSCNEGKTFYEVPDSRFCDSCGVKTLICPHFVNERERIFPLPKNCTHIKVVRPKVKVRRKRKSKKKMEDEKHGTVEMLPRLKLVWDDFLTRTNTERRLKRTLTEDFILSIIDQFYGLQVWQDEYQSTDEKTYSFLDSFYHFLEDRYVLDDAVLFVFHDILSAVEKYAISNKQIHLFAACLCGSIDPSAFRYVLLMTEYINSFMWLQMQDFTSFLSIVYPFLTEDDYEQLKMGYTSFSENKVSAYLVYSYLLYIVLNGKEPRFLELESKLLQCPVRKPGYFTDIEFAEAVDSFVPLASERLLQRLFLQSVQHFPEADETVHVGRISHITSYLSLLQDSPRIRNSIKQWKVEREATLKDLQDPKHVKSTTQESRHTALITLSRIKLLGTQMRRRARARDSYQQQQQLAMEFEDIQMEENPLDLQENDH